jgi:hypothetical protein
VCTVSGSTVTLVSAGTCTIEAVQPETNTFKFAWASATQSFSVTTGAVSLTAVAGATPQSANVQVAFAHALAVTARDAVGKPVISAPVLFTAPAADTSGIFTNGSTSITVYTDANGLATAPFTANVFEGGPYAVTATSGNSQVSFSLTNTGPTVTANGGTPQTAAVGKAFTTALAVKLTQNGAPVSGAIVMFMAPASGASGSFSNGAATLSVTTDGSGSASTTFTANTVAGTYTVNAIYAPPAVAGMAPFLETWLPTYKVQATFSLTNK